MKIFYITTIIIAILCFAFWRAFIYYEIPPQENFIGMTRQQVAEWADKNGRLLYLEKNHPQYGTIKLKTGPLNRFYKSTNDIFNDANVMKEPIWDIGWKELKGGVRFAWRVKFENDIVIENTYTTISDW